MRALGIGDLLFAFLAMAYLGPAIAIAAHLITRGGYWSPSRPMRWTARVYGTLEAAVIGVLWLPALVVLLVRALIGR